MSRLMRCSRVGGVILYSFDNGHFMAYTSPPPTAEPLLKEKPFGECTFQLSPIAVQRLHSYSTRPRGMHAAHPAAFQPYQPDFYVTTQPSLVLSWAPRKYRPPSFLLSIPPKNEPPPSCDDGGVLLAIIPGFRRAARPRDILPRGCPRRNRRPCLPGLRGCSG